MKLHGGDIFTNTFFQNVKIRLHSLDHLLTKLTLSFSLWQPVAHTNFILLCACIVPLGKQFGSVWSENREMGPSVLYN